MARPRSRGGFTLLEALVSMIILGFVTMAVAGAMSAGMQAAAGASVRSTNDARIRVIFDALTRDIEGAYASSTNQFTCFTTQTTVGGQSSAGSSILTFSTLGHRITSDPAGSSQSSMASPDSGVVPQSDMGLVRWDFDQGSHKLSRIVNKVPGITTLMSAAAGDQDLIDGNVQDISFSFYDSVQQQWSSTWDLQPTWTSSASSGSSTGTGTTGTTGAAAPAAAATAAPTSTASQTSGTGQNQYLPQFVQITVTLLDANGTPQTYTTQVPIVTWATLSGQSLTTSSSSTSGGTTGGAAK